MVTLDNLENQKLLFLMPKRLISKVTKFQLPPLKCFGTVVKNILGGHHGPMSNRVKIFCYNQAKLVTGTCGCTVVNSTFYPTSFTWQLVQVMVLVPCHFVCLVIRENSPLQDREFGMGPFTLVVTRGFLRVLSAWKIPFDNVESFVWDTTFSYFYL